MAVKTYDKSKDRCVQLSKNFKVREFACKCSRCSIALVDEELVRILQQIRDHFNQRLAEYKWIRILEFVSELHKTISGKIRKTELRGTM